MAEMPQGYVRLQHQIQSQLDIRLIGMQHENEHQKQRFEELEKKYDHLEATVNLLMGDNLRDHLEGVVQRIDDAAGKIHAGLEAAERRATAVVEVLRRNNEALIRRPRQRAGLVGSSGTGDRPPIVG